jgi:CBS domain-containing protein
MRIADVLRTKGTEVATVEPTMTVSQLLVVLAEHNIGASVVCDGDDVVGIVSERDVVRQLRDQGADLLQKPVSEIMSTDLATCAPDETVDHLTVLMTERRIRHVPVLSGGRLVGIVSIGDVVKNRMDELEHVQEQLQAYIVQG